MSDPCAVCGQPGSRWQVCPTCQDRVQADLDEVTALLALLHRCRHRLELPGSGDGNRRGRGIDPAAPGDLHVMGLDDPRSLAVAGAPSPAAWAASWCLLLAEERALASLPPDPPGQALLLAAWWPSIAETAEWAGALAGETVDVRRVLDSAVRGPRFALIELGTCPVVLPASDTGPARECGATLRHRAEEWAIRCRACGSWWVGPLGWARLAEMMRAEPVAGA